MLTLLLAAAPLCAQSDFDPTFDPFAAGASHGGQQQGLAASSGCDEFARADSGDLGPGWSEAAGDMEIRSELLHGLQINSLSVMEGVNADYRSSEISCSFQTNGQKLYYVALVAGYRNLDHCVHVKVQDADYDSLVDRVYFRYGNNKAPWNANSYFFDLAQPTAFGTMTLSFRNNGDTARLELENPFSGETEVFQCSGLSAKAGQLGTGFGISTYGDCYADNVVVNEGACTTAFQMTASGSPGNVMTFSIEGATPSEQVILVFGNGAGSFAIPKPYACEGTILDFAVPYDLIPFRADQNGQLSWSRPVPPAAVGLRVQALDVVSCAVSAVYVF